MSQLGREDFVPGGPNGAGSDSARWWFSRKISI